MTYTVINVITAIFGALSVSNIFAAFQIYTYIPCITVVFIASQVTTHRFNQSFVACTIVAVICDYLSGAPHGLSSLSTILVFFIAYYLTTHTSFKGYLVTFAQIALATPLFLILYAGLIVLYYPSLSLARLFSDAFVHTWLPTLLYGLVHVLSVTLIHSILGKRKKKSL